MKNIKDFCGKPLILWSIEALLGCDAIDRIVVATDCQEVEDVVKEASPKVQVYHRSDENAQDTSSTESVMLEYLDKHPLKPDDIFVLVQCTSPFTRSRDFVSALLKYNTRGYDSMLSCVSSRRFFWSEEGTPINYDFMARPRRQDFSGMYMENGAFYINRVKNILRYKNRLSGNIGQHIMPEYTGIEIDEPEDWLVAEAVMRRMIKGD